MFGYITNLSATVISLVGNLGVFVEDVAGLNFAVGPAAGFLLSCAAVLLLHDLLPVKIVSRAALGYAVLHIGFCVALVIAALSSPAPFDGWGTWRNGTGFVGVDWYVVLLQLSITLNESALSTCDVRRGMRPCGRGERSYGFSHRLAGWGAPR